MRKRCILLWKKADVGFPKPISKPPLPNHEDGGRGCLECMRESGGKMNLMARRGLRVEWAWGHQRHLLAILLASALFSTPLAARERINNPKVSVQLTVPAALRALETANHQLAAIKLENQGELRVEAVRQRMGAISALAGVAEPYFRGKNVEYRLWAHWIVADAHQTFAAELSRAKAPHAAQKEAWTAWVQQLDNTLEQMVRTARAHLRSCVSLAQAAQSSAPISAACKERLEKSSTDGSLPLKELVKNPSLVARLRMDEIQGCQELVGAGKKNQVRLKALVSLDKLGRVEGVGLSPRYKKQAALRECIAKSLWLWVFPGISNAELEIPILLKSIKK